LYTIRAQHASVQLKFQMGKAVVSGSGSRGFQRDPDGDRKVGGGANRPSGTGPQGRRPSPQAPAPTGEDHPRTAAPPEGPQLKTAQTTTSREQQVAADPVSSATPSPLPPAGRRDAGAMEKHTNHESAKRQLVRATGPSQLQGSHRPVAETAATSAAVEAWSWRLLLLPTSGTRPGLGWAALALTCWLAAAPAAAGVATAAPPDSVGGGGQPHLPSGDWFLHRVGLGNWGGGGGSRAA
jgi:hypothetical protein